MSKLPEQVSESVRRLNPHIFKREPWDKFVANVINAAEERATVKPLRQSSATRTKAEHYGMAHSSRSEVADCAVKRLRQSAKKLNKTEAAFKAWLHAEFPDDWVHAQEMTFLLANGVRYTPDFVRVQAFNFLTHCYEVKGFMRDDAAVKLKVAASKFPWATWWLVWKEEGEWKRQRIEP